MSHHETTAAGRYVRGPAWFAIVVGIAMVVIWAWFLVTDDIPDLETRPLGTALHIAGELATAALLIAAGWGLLSGAAWARKLYLLAIGMLLLAAIHGLAWYSEQGSVGMGIGFLVLAILGVFFALRAEE